MACRSVYVPFNRATVLRITAPLLVTMLMVGPASGADRRSQPEIAGGGVPVLKIDGLRFRDLDRDGHLSPFEDWRIPPERRAHDLVRRMTLSEKAGAMMHDALPVKDNIYDMEALRTLVLQDKMSSFIGRLAADGRILAQQANAAQAVAESARIAIPLTISTDPRSHFQVTDGASVAAVSMSKWPETTGFAAIGDPALVEHFASIARREYRAAGFNMVLAPQADLATEPRWPRINGTFGEDPVRVRAMVAAYVRGFQGGPRGLASGGIPAVVKHWVGYGASDKGYDGHSHYGRFATLDRQSLKIHADAFKGAFAAGVSGVMPAYSIVRVGNESNSRFPPVGAAFNRHLITDLLRKRYGFRGIVLSDWGITRDCGDLCRNGFPAGVMPTREGFSTAWGQEDARAEERFARAVAAGVDQFGGVSDSGPLVSAVLQHFISEARIDRSVERIMALKFRTGLFENPYVDPNEADRLSDASQFRSEGLRAQARALTILKRDPANMPLPRGRKVWSLGLAADVARAHGLVPVERPEEADFGIVRLAAPWKGEHPQYYYGSRQHEGSLAFQGNDPVYARLREAAEKIPVIAVVYLDRPAILSQLVPHVSGLVVDFGASDEALLDGLSGKVMPEGHLPFELPSSEAAVENQRGDLPHDSAMPLFPIGFGLSLTGTANNEKVTP
ncbi:beta-glucosidase (plasmid) [Novosphingobium sp. PP1Y]|nr:beta-glucosidase [Novosphingobium sp. PP1Y]